MIDDMQANTLLGKLASSVEGHTIPQDFGVDRPVIQSLVIALGSSVPGSEARRFSQVELVGQVRYVRRHCLHSKKHSSQKQIR